MEARRTARAGWRREPARAGRRPFLSWDLCLSEADGAGRVDGWNVLGVGGKYQGPARSEIRALTLTGRPVPGALATRGRFALERRGGALDWGDYEAVDRFVATDLVLASSVTGRTRIFRFESMRLDRETRRVESFRICELLPDGRSLRRAVTLERFGVSVG